jgi:hypothetical protein
MKTLLLLLFPLFIYAQGGNTCSQALANPLPIGSTVMNTTCGQGDDFSASNLCNTLTPINANDFLYAITPTNSGMVTVNLTANILGGFTTNTMYSVLVVYQSCPTLNSCITSNFTILTSTLTFTYSVAFEVLAGSTYFILVDGWRPQMGWANCYNYILSTTLSISPTNNGCTNDGFASGLSGWFGSQGLAFANTAGQPIPLYMPINANITPPRVTVANSFTDACLPFTVTSPFGGNFVRLGRQVINREANRISYRFTVTPQRTSFTYTFLPILKDPVHLPHNQPFFEAIVYLQNGVVIPCSRYIVAANQGLVGYLNSPLCTNPTVIYRPWSTVNVDLSNWIGQTVTVQFTAGGCSQSAHWGYVYLDYRCEQSLIFNATYNICENNCITLSTPPNYINYVWLNGGPIVCPTVSTIYNLQTTSQNGCLRTFQIPVNVNISPEVIIFPN